MRPPTLEEKIKFRRRDSVLIGFDQHEGWKGELPFYKFKCSEHGDVINYEQGFDAFLECPQCQENRLHRN